MQVPEDIRLTPQIPFEFLKRKPASYQNLLVLLSRGMTDEMLWQIAEADYGYRKEECFAMLKVIVTKQVIPEKVDFILGECLELYRWTEPKPEETAAHLTRAFCAMMLLILEVCSDHNNMDENANLATLIESVTAIDTGCKEAQELIIWRLLFDFEVEKKAYEEDENDKLYVAEIMLDRFFIYALIVMMIYNRAPEAHVESVLNWIIDMEKYSQNIAPFYHEGRDEKYVKEYRSTHFLLGSTNFTQRHGAWKAISEKMLHWKAYLKADAMHIQLENIVACILNDEPLEF